MHLIHMQALEYVTLEQLKAHAVDFKPEDN